MELLYDWFFMTEKEKIAYNNETVSMGNAGLWRRPGNGSQQSWNYPNYTTELGNVLYEDDFFYVNYSSDLS